MELRKTVTIRRYEERDFPAIHALNKTEGWSNLVEKHEDAKQAWGHSNAAFIAEKDEVVVGCLRGLTDGYITLYVAELIVDKKLRGNGIGKELLAYAHTLYPKTRLELLASSTSSSYYELQGYRPFYGFRKTISE